MATNFKMLSCRKVAINSAGYEQGKYGGYYGTGQPLYRMNCELDGTEQTFETRANSRREAIDDIVSDLKYRCKIVETDKLTTFRFHYGTLGLLFSHVSHFYYEAEDAFGTYLASEGKLRSNYLNATLEVTTEQV